MVSSSQVPQRKDAPVTEQPDRPDQSEEPELPEEPDSGVAARASDAGAASAPDQIDQPDQADEDVGADQDIRPDQADPADQPDHTGEPQPGGAPEQARAPERAGEAEQPAGPAQQAQPSGHRPGRSAMRWLLGVILVLAVAAALGVVGWLGWQVLDTVQRDPSRADVGDCLAGSDDPGELGRVDCVADEASWLVVGKHTDLAWSEFRQMPGDELCADHPETELAVWFGDDRDRGPGDVFCLEPLG